MKIPYLSKWGKRFRFYRGIQLKKAAVLAILGVTVIGTGYPPTGMNGSQAKMMARRAAIVSCYRQLSEEGIHSVFRIVGENLDGGSYEVEMTY